MSRAAISSDAPGLYQDGAEFLAIAAKAPIRAATTRFPLAEANEALTRLRDGQIEGAAVLIPETNASDS
jgi:D-arabinose 1-dehydrogenase-like Zn-dependent alcohol dehydrogenase